MKTTQSKNVKSVQVYTLFFRWIQFKTNFKDNTMNVDSITGSCKMKRMNNSIVQLLFLCETQTEQLKSWKIRLIQAIIRRSDLEEETSN